MSKPTQTPAHEINNLHGEIEQALRNSLANALKIGALLTDTKESLPHGSFTGWINDNLTFTPRTARRYLKLHNNRGQLNGAEPSEEIELQ